MKKIFLYSLLFVTVITNISCGESASKGPIVYEKINAGTTATDSVAVGTTAKDTLPVTADQHNASNSLDWAGTYKGVLPCADCEGVSTQVTLSKDSTYTIATSYLGKAVKAINQKGKFTWNAAGNTINLAGENGTPNLFFVGENSLTQLDALGNKITGPLADKFILVKQMAEATANNQADATLVNTYWKLTELMGKPVAKTKDGVRETHILLKKINNSIKGFTGCNTIMGSYELKEGNYLRFTKLASTLMACDDMKTEDDFKKVLGQTDNYSISGENLSISKAKMAPLAKFKAMYF